jgi:glycosyltransferase involved in cell wall biosynthesis
MQLSVIIPVFNEESTIKEILERVLGQNNVQEIIIVDDGSSDKTFDILQRSKIKNSKLKILRHLKNKGKGAAIRTGISKAKGDYILIQDADLEYDPREYKKLIRELKFARVIYGSRIMGKSPHAYFLTYLGNIAITAICNILFGTKLTDIYTCYKLIPANIIKNLQLNSNGFEIEGEITGKLLKRGISIREVAIGYKPRSYEKGKKIKAKDAVKGALKLLSVRFS